MDKRVKKKLEEAVAKGDMEAVRAILDKEDNKKTPKKQVKDYIAPTKDTQKVKKRFNDSGIEEGSYGRSEPVQFKGNQFDDDGLDAQDLRQETLEQRKKLEEGKIARRDKRPPATKVKIACHDCGTVVEVFKSALFTKYYVCDKCIRRKWKV